MSKPEHDVICWLSSGAYTNPLNETEVKKWQLLAGGLQQPIHLIGFASGWRPQTFYEHITFHLLPRPSISVLRYLSYYLFAPWLALWLVWRSHVGVFIAQSPYEAVAGTFAKQVSRLFGQQIRLIVENHNNFEEDLFLQRNIRFRGMFVWFMRRAAHYSLRSADALRSVSSSTEEQLRQYAPSTPLMRFMAWSDAAVFLEQERLVAIEDTRDIVYAGVLIPRKGVHILLEAFAGLPTDAQLYLVGKAENEDYAQELAQQAQQLGIAERVHLVGAVTQSVLAAYFAKARVSVLPSLSEGLGRVVVESMLCGTPVIGSNVGGIPDLIQDRENGYLVRPNDVASLRQALTKILNQEDIGVMSEQARAFAQTVFTPDAYLDHYCELLQLAQGN